MKKKSRAQRGEKFDFAPFSMQNWMQKMPSADLKRRSFLNTPEVRVAFIYSIQGCTHCRNIFAVSFQSIKDRRLRAESLRYFLSIC